MRAIVLAEFGPPDNLLYARVDDPEPGPGQLRINVKCAPVHLLDARRRAGIALDGNALPTLPVVPGEQVAGVVEAVGEDVSADWVSRRVIANVTTGGYAEVAVADVDSSFEIPSGIDFDVASVMLSTGPTALAIMELASLRPNDTVLVLAAAGSLGTLLSRHARSLGAFVIGLTSTHKLNSVDADLVIDYNTADWPEQIRATGREPTVVLEGVGGQPAETAFRLLSSHGRAVSYGAASGDFAHPPQDIEHQLLFESSMMETLSDPASYRVLVQRCLQQATNLTPRIQPFPLGDAPDAHEAIESRHTSGQVVLIP